jgi:hypothetical protein
MSEEITTKDMTIPALLDRVKKGMTDENDADHLWNLLVPDDRAKTVESFNWLNGHTQEAKELIGKARREILAMKLL